MDPIHGVQPVEGEYAEPGTDDLRTYNSTIMLRVSSHENAMRIRCVANHTMLEGGQNYSDVSLNVRGNESITRTTTMS
jgi:hypothetical protein